MDSPKVTVLNGSTFMVSDQRGDVDARPEQPEGFFYRDMRHLSTWQLRWDGRALDQLSTQLDEDGSAVFFLFLPTGTVHASPTASVIRRRSVGAGLREEITVRNHDSHELVVELAMVFGADFADIFEVKDRLAKVGETFTTTGAEQAVLHYRRADFARQTTISAPGAVLAAGSLSFPVTVPAGESWQTVLTVEVAEAGSVTPRPASSPPPDPAGWVERAPVLDCDWDDLRRVYARSIRDLAALRFYPSDSTAALPAAGLPWFMALFGRDSIITSYQALPFLPELAATTLLALAARQATSHDDFRDAEPGKILHELRFGELVHFGQRPHSPYYGSADSTALFLILLDEYEYWTGDRELVRQLEQPARAALNWLAEDGDLDGDGYQEYRRRNLDTGLENQCWKDSPNAVVHPDGTLAVLPRATCELQGYAYDAQRRAARLAREVWADRSLAERLERAAAELKHRFNHDFWLADEQYFALALDGDKRPVRTVTSNPGHLLWSGIVDDDRAAAMAAKLLGEELFSGWGVRTLATGQGAFNPLSYHNGSVWPHDNALIAAGLARYGRREDAGRIARATLEAAGAFDYRLPEVFAGYPRDEAELPVAYPTACSPQAWAAGTPLLLLRILLDLQPGSDRAETDPGLPQPVGRISMHNLPTSWTAGG
ncbi:MAG TPA: glycogen debranching N-terminal domain-containing protein [Jatrophihabitans sp.]|nr:glycogen debranching N-terminal domain-containing protein [Jatrophihabitans sp.]